MFLSRLPFCSFLLIPLAWIMGLLLTADPVLGQVSSTERENHLPAEAEKEKLRAEGDQALAARNYSAALESYSLMAKRFPRERYAWQGVAAAYYHLGQPDKSLALLRKLRSQKGSGSSFGELYEGLSLMALGETSLGMRRLAIASRGGGVYSEMALFERIRFAFEKDRRAFCRRSIAEWKKRFPRGAFKDEIEMIEAGLAGAKIDSQNLSRFDYPDPEKTKFRLHPRSLGEEPHFWLLGLGFVVDDAILADPAPDQPKGIRPSKNIDQWLRLDAAIGLGPKTIEGLNLIFAYHYQQDWLTSSERLDQFSKSPADPSYFPFRPDLLQRKHRFYADLGMKLSEAITLGAYLEKSFSRLGTSLYQGPDEVEVIQSSQEIEDQQTLKPKISLQYLKYFQSTLFLDFSKRILADSMEFSKQSYEFGGSSPGLSFGFIQRASWPELNLDLELSFFRFDWIHNDRWLDFSRLGGGLNIAFGFFRGLTLNTQIGTYTDDYQIPVLKQGACSSIASTESSTQSGLPSRCSRKDEGYLLGIGLAFNFSEFTQVSGSFSLSENSNKTLEVYNKTQSTYVLGISTAFPSLPAVRRNLFQNAGTSYEKDQL